MNMSLELVCNETLEKLTIELKRSTNVGYLVLCVNLIFFMQTGFALLEIGCVSKKNEVNVIMKNVIDIVMGGCTYWAVGFSMSFGYSSHSNGFIGIGNYFMDALVSDDDMGDKFLLFLFQLSFATTATTIVSGAVAERCNFRGYTLFAFFNVIIYCIPAGWVWAEHGFLNKMGVVDIAGSGPIHLLGGVAAFVSAAFLGPRLGRYTEGKEAPPLGNPVSAFLGTFFLWWGWLAFNSGSVYGLGGPMWKYTTKASVMTIMGSLGGGFSSTIYSMIRNKGNLMCSDLINGVLGALVSVTAGCCLYRSWEAWLIGVIGGLLAPISAPLFDKMKIDDPVGAVAVHGVCGIWGVLAVGLFADNPIPLDLTRGRYGLFKGGGWYLLGVQALSVVCIISWTLVSTFLLLFIVDKITKLRMDPENELLGADLSQHNVDSLKVQVVELKSGVSGADAEHTLEELRRAEEKLRQWRTFLNQLSPLQTPVETKKKFVNTNSDDHKIYSVGELFSRKLQSNKNGTYNVNGTELPVYRTQGSDNPGFSQ